MHVVVVVVQQHRPLSADAGQGSLLGVDGRTGEGDPLVDAPERPGPGAVMVAVGGGVAGS